MKIVEGSLWQHYNGNQYEVLIVANENAGDEVREKYPATVVYKNINNGKVYARRKDDWDRSMRLYSAE